MQSVFFEEAKQNFDVLCQRACQNHEPYIVNRADNNHVVMMSLEDFNAWQEIQRGKVKSPKRRKRYSLAELLTSVTAETMSELNAETSWARDGQSVGRELV